MKNDSPFKDVIFIGRDHPTLGYGQTGYAFYDSSFGNKWAFRPDNDYNEHIDNMVKKKDLCFIDEYGRIKV